MQFLLAQMLAQLEKVFIFARADARAPADQISFARELGGGFTVRFIWVHSNMNWPSLGGGRFALTGCKFLILLAQLSIRKRRSAALP